MNAFAKSALMEQFRGLLKKNSMYALSPELQKAFKVARAEIVKLVRRSVRSFRLVRIRA